MTSCGTAREQREGRAPDRRDKAQAVPLGFSKAMAKFSPGKNCPTPLFQASPAPCPSAGSQQGPGTPVFVVGSTLLLRGLRLPHSQVQNWTWVRKGHVGPLTRQGDSACGQGRDARVPAIHRARRGWRAQPPASPKDTHDPEAAHGAHTAVPGVRLPLDAAAVDTGAHDGGGGQQGQEPAGGPAGSGNLQDARAEAQSPPEAPEVTKRHRPCRLPSWRPESHRDYPGRAWTVHPICPGRGRVPGI